MKFIQLQNLAAHRSRVLGWTYPFTWASITWTYMQLREGIKISTMNLGTHALLTQEWVPWKKETHLPIFESGHVSSHGINFLSRFILSFCVNFYVPLPKLNMKPWKKKSYLPSSESESVLPFEKPFFYSLHPWTLAWENCVLNGSRNLVIFSDPTSRILSIPTGVLAEFRTMDHYSDHYIPIVHVDWYLCVTLCNLM